MKVFTGVDILAYTSKPQKKCAGIIRERITQHYQVIEINKLAELAASGHALLPGHLVGGCKAENWTEMQLFILDFDSGITYREVAQRASSYNLPIFFAYHTYSSSHACEKFRVSFTFPKVIDDRYVAKIILLMLHEIFPECDPCCKDLCRLFYGGKDIIYVDDKAYIAFVDLLYALNKALDRNGNYVRNIKSFCNANHILMMSDRPVMGSEESESVFGKIDDFKDSIIHRIIIEDSKSSFFIVRDTRKHEVRSFHQGNTCQQQLKGVHIKTNKGCLLLNNFCEGQYINHEGMFHLFTNLKNIDGGSKLFFDVLERRGDLAKYDYWKSNQKYCKGYHPQRCSKNCCPHYTICEDKGTIVNTLADDRSITVDPETYYTLEEARECLKQNLEMAIESNDIGIHLIKAQTAMGKTFTYINLIEEYVKKKFIVALPTNILKQQVYDNLCIKLSNEEVFITASVNDNYLIPPEVQEAICSDHDRGIHNTTKSTISEYMRKIQKEAPESLAVLEQCEDILNGIKPVKDQRVIVTTHAYLLCLMQVNPQFLNDYEIIIDEDILLLQIFHNIKSVPLDTLEKVAKMNFNEYSSLARQIVDTPDDQYCPIYPNPSVSAITEEDLNDIEGGWDGNVRDLTLARTFVRLKDKDTGQIMVHYFCPQQIYPKKYIVMSATLNENVYESYFSRQRMKVYTYPEKKARYKGTLKQWPYHSLGRSDLGNKPDVFHYACQQANDHDLCFITFACFPKKSTIKGIHFSDLHFGNTTGINKLKGKNIGVVGTYFQQEQAYKLIALYLKADVNNKMDKSPRRRRVSYKNKNFVITTYNDDLLREIQLYSIESEMEQCVGRARLLSQDCTVYLFSCFPCEQAELHTANYLASNIKDSCE
ncbi:MAG: DEAD/DEAH box helicase family protein [Lachnospiraceae bacterium]|nr:DEAD/DEAH box helicase family protein [Lachnospiraceae bacterium]